MAFRGIKEKFPNSKSVRKFPQWIMAENRHVFVLPENQQDQQHHCLCKGDFHISGNSLEAAAATALRRAGDAN